MKRQNIIYGIVVIATVALGFSYLILASSNDFLQKHPTSVGSFNDVQYFKIDPNTVLTTLEKNNILLFQSESGPSLNRLTEAPISWRQADFEKIAKKIFEIVWRSPQSGWSLYRIIFSSVCYDNPTGFDSADFVYFKETYINGGRVYTGRDIFITPQYGDIAVGNDTNFPRPLFGWKHIPLSNIKVSAEEALQLAESNGGEAARLSMQNKCSIHVSMNPDGYGHRNWKVSYSGNGNLPSFETVIPGN